jgi:hypothetical protein
MQTFTAVLVGIVTSLAGSFLYAEITSTPIPWSVALISTLALSAAILLGIKLAPRVRLMIRSGITGFYPDGQEQYLHDLQRDLKKSKSLTVIGARGLDLVGESSPIGNFLKTAQDCEVNVFLLDPDSHHARLRIGHLDVERQKYHSESASVDHYLAVLKLQQGISIRAYSYDEEPRWRAIILDSAAYVAFYRDGVQGRKLPCYRIADHSTHLYLLVKKEVTALRSRATPRTYAATVPAVQNSGQVHAHQQDVSSL